MHASANEPKKPKDTPEQPAIPTEPPPDPPAKPKRTSRREKAGRRVDLRQEEPPPRIDLIKDSASQGGFYGFPLGLVVH